MERDVRVLPRMATAAATLLPLLAGCLAAAPGTDDAPEAAAPAPAVVTYEGVCSAALMFQFIDYAQTDRYLPPGFHPRDPKEFLTILPVATGQAGAIFLAVQCADDGDGGPAFSSVSIFVEPPFVAGFDPGLFDFYEIERSGSADPFRPALHPSGWPEHDAVVTVDMASPVPDQEPVQLAVVVSDTDGVLASFDGVARAEVDVGTGPVRFWHDGPAGLGVLQIVASLDSRVGAGRCTARSGTALADFMGGTSCVPPAEPVLAMFPGLGIAAEARFLPGVHAE